MSDTCIVQLGRMGDLLNVMPIAAAWRCAMMVHSGYADLVRGCSAIHVDEWHGSLEDPAGAQVQACKRYPRVITTQLFGRGGRNQDRQCEQYCLEEWHRAGVLEQFGKWPLYFDRRDKVREAELFMSLDDRRPMLLLSLEGVSGPFRDATWLRAEINAKWNKKFNIVELPEVKCAKFYDLLGLYDRASLLVTVDTSTLHLCWASRVPAIQLLSFEPEPWHGSVSKGNCKLSMKYAEARARIREIHAEIDAA